MDGDEDKVVHERTEFLDVSYGEAQAVQTLIRGLATKFQFVALNNQFVRTEIEPEEVEQIRALNNARDLEEFKLQEKTPTGEVVRTVRFQLHNREQAEEMADHRLAVAFDSDNHWEVVS